MSFLRGAGKTAVESIGAESTEAQIPKAELEIIAGVVEQLQMLAVMLKKQGATEDAHPTLNAVIKAHHTIEDAGVRFKRADGRNILEKTAVLRDFVNHKHQYLDDMKSMAEGFNEIEVTSDTVDSWSKLAKWLDALHECTASQLRKPGQSKGVEIQREKDQTFPYVDAKDWAFKKATKGMAKYTLVRYYGEAAKTIESKVAEFNRIALQVSPNI